MDRLTNESCLESLLEKLSSGDSRAAEQVFHRYEPYLRTVVRRLLPARMRSRFDSLDIVQSALTDAWRAFRANGNCFANANQLRAFLVTATRNRFFDRYREHDRDARREVDMPHETSDAGTQGKTSTPSQVVEADELWQRLLAVCPAEYQGLLRLKRDGASNEEIADQTGLHVGSIRRIFRQLACRLPNAGR